MDRGFIKLDRGILNWEWFTDANVYRVFTYLLIIANYEDTLFKGEVIRRGETATTYARIAEALDLSYMAVRRAIDKLKGTGEVTITRRSKFVVISINNYIKYQGGEQSDEQSDEQSLKKERKKQRKKELFKKQRNIYSAFANVFLDNAEYMTLQEGYPNDYKRLIEELGEYKAKSGKEYSSDYAAVISFANFQGIEKERDYTIENDFEFMDDGTVRTVQVKVFKDGHRERG